MRAKKILLSFVSIVVACTIALNGSVVATAVVPSQNPTVTVVAESYKWKASLAPDARNTDDVGWKIYKERVRLGVLSSVVGRHTVVVVPMRPKGTPAVTSKAEQARILKEVGDFWRDRIPGLTIKFIVKKTVTVPAKYCSQGDLALDLASKKTSGYNPERRLNHLAAIVDCDGWGGWADLRLGYGRIFASTWSSDVIAHEFGHNLAVIHGNTLYCKDWQDPTPKTCRQVEYGDLFDVMGAGGIVPLAGLFGFWRALILGAQRVSPNTATTFTLERQGNSRRGIPLSIDSGIGPIFMDHTLAKYYDYMSGCQVDGAQMRVATLDRQGKAGQARIPILTLRGVEVETVTLFDPFNIPGTNYRAYLSAHSTDSVKVRVIPKSDTAAPTWPDGSLFPKSPVILVSSESRRMSDLWNREWHPVELALPGSPGVAGYRVEIGDSECGQGLEPGARFSVVPDSYDPDQVKIIPVGQNGMLGNALIWTAKGEALEVTISEEYVLNEEDGDTFQWSVPSGQSQQLMDALTHFTIAYAPPSPSGCLSRECEPDIVQVARLSKNQRDWNPWGVVRENEDADGCLLMILRAHSEEGVLAEENVQACLA